MFWISVTLLVGALLAAFLGYVSVASVATYVAWVVYAVGFVVLLVRLPGRRRRH